MDLISDKATVEVISWMPCSVLSLLKKETFVRIDIPCNDTQHEVRLSHQHVSIEHFWKRPDRFAELIEVGATMCVKTHLRENVRVKSDLAPINDRHAGPDNPFAFQSINAAPAR